MRLLYFLRTTLIVWASTFVVIARRIRRGRARPTWSFVFEVLARVMKQQFASLSKLSFPQQREAWGAVAMPHLLGLKVSYGHTTLGGVKCETAEPRAGGAERTLLYLHGGAYLFGSIPEYREMIGRLAIGARARVVAPEYRLAPEHPFPQGLDDAVAVLRALLAEAEPSRIVLAGDSAGGGMVAATLLRARDEGLPLPARAALLSPWIDLAAEGGSIDAHEPYDFFSPALIAGWAREYLHGAEATNPYASPAHAQLRGLPPLLVIVGGAEMILDQVRRFSQRATEAGVRCELEEWPDMFHNFFLFAALFSSSARAMDRVCEFLRGDR